jgi:hypothetical protein
MSRLEFNSTQIFAMTKADLASRQPMSSSKDQLGIDSPELPADALQPLGTSTSSQCMRHPEEAEISSNLAQLPQPEAPFWPHQQALVPQDTSFGFDIEQENADYNAWFHARRVCDKCQLIFDNFHDREQWTSKGPKHYHHSLDSLEKSAAECPICELFVSDLKIMADSNEHRRFKDLDRTIPGRVTVEKHIIFSYLMLKLTLGTKPNPRDLRDVNLELELSLTKSGM